MQQTLYWGPLACDAYNIYGWYRLEDYPVPPPGTTQSTYLLQAPIFDVYYSCYANPPYTTQQEKEVIHCEPEALYLANATGLHAVDSDSGANYALDSQPADPDAMASLAGSVYEVVGGHLKKVDVETGAVSPFSAYPDGWAGTEAMTSLGDSLYAVQAGTLFRVHRTGWVAPFSDYPEGWEGTEAMTALGDSLYVVQAGTLYRVRNDGAVWQYSANPDGWTGTTAMAAKNGFVYAVQGGTLWAVHVESGSVAPVGGQVWTGTAAMVAR